tara:strand:+ start:132 stop:251 length:120 start_codon:yes stop_codon:yes gene_type:complete
MDDGMIMADLTLGILINNSFALINPKATASKKSFNAMKT